MGGAAIHTRYVEALTMFTNISVCATLLSVCAMLLVILASY